MVTEFKFHAQIIPYWKFHIVYIVCLSVIEKKYKAVKCTFLYTVCFLGIQQVF